MISLQFKPQKYITLKDVKDLHFSENIEQFNTTIKKARSIADAQVAYDNALSAYMHFHILLSAPPIFADPFTNFVYYNHSVHYIYNKAISIFDNIAFFFSTLQLPYSPDLVVETKLLKALVNLLKAFKPLSRAEKSLFMYEEKHNSAFPLFQFFLLENTVCFWYLDNRALKCIVLTGALMQSNFVYSWDTWKTLFPILKATRNNKFMANFIYSKASNPYYMYIKINGLIIAIKYNESTRTFNTFIPHPSNLNILHSDIIQNNIPLLLEYDISHLFYHTKCNLKSLNALTVTDKLARFLFHLTNGNYQNLIHLAILCANIGSPEIITPKLFLVTYNDINSDISIPEYFSHILDFIFNTDQVPYFSLNFPSINKLVMKKYIPDLSNNLFNETKLILLSKGSSSLRDTQRKTLCQYIKGSRINARDTKIGSISYRNICPIICFSKSHKETVYLEQNFPCIRIDLDFIENFESLQTPDFEQNPETYEWLRIYLPLYGLYLMGEKKFHKQPLPKKQIVSAFSSQDAIIEDFLSSCCTASKNSFVYTDILYDAYTFYYCSVHKSLPLNRTQFVKAVKQVPGLVYKRPHISRTEPNKYAFTGISLKSDWKSCFATSIDSLSLEEEAFKRKLQEITSLLLDMPQ